MPFEDTLQHLPHMLQEVKAVGNLHRIGSATARPFGVLGGAIARNQLDAWVLFEPRFHNPGRAFWLEVDRSMGVEVDEDRSIALAFAEGKIVDAEMAWGGRRGGRLTTGEAQEGIGADGHTLAPCQAATRFTTNFQPKMALLIKQTCGAAGIGQQQSWYGLAKRLAPAVCVVAEEATDVEVELNGDMGQGQIGQRTLVAAMHAPGPVLAARTDRLRSGCMDVNGHTFWQELSFAKFEQCSRGQEERFAHRLDSPQQTGRTDLLV